MVQRDFTHNLGSLEYAIVKVYYRARSGPNQGYIFEAAGASQSDDDGGSYGGVVFGYTDTAVRVFLPNNTDSSRDNCASGSNGWSLLSGSNICQSCSILGGYPCTHREGSAIFVPAGFGGGRFTQLSHEVDVRVRIWIVTPDFVSEGISLTSNGVAYSEYFHYANTAIDRVVVVVRGNSISPTMYFTGITAAAGTDIRPRVYGGVIYAYSTSTVRLWAPAQSNNDMWHAYGQACSIGDGWGSGLNVVNSQSVTVKVMIYLNTARGALDNTDTSLVTFNIRNNNEIPNLKVFNFNVTEGKDPIGYVVSTVSASDVDGTTLSDYAIVGGNIDDAFGINNQGGIYINNPAAIDYYLRQNFSLEVSVSDGYLTEIGTAFVNVLYTNRPPVVHAPYGRAVRELSIWGAPVGEPLNATDRDITQSILFSLMSRGNYRDAFGISTCSGQIYVNNPDAIDHENITGFDGFNLTVMVTDDGPNAENRTYRIPISILNTNEPPFWDSISFTLNVTENSPLGTKIYPSLSSWCHGTHGL
jgi:hypothetical protein